VEAGSLPAKAAQRNEEGASETRESGMNMKYLKYGLLILLVCQAALLTGCTSALWEKQSFADRYRPANPPNLQLFYSESAKDVLVEYDEVSTGAPVVQRRAYWLEPNAMKVATDCKPRFVPAANTPDFAAVPVTDNPANPAVSSYRGLYAVVATNGQSFTLCLGEKEATVYKLPVYFGGSRQRAKQVLLTPIAVAADAAIVGGALAYAVARGEAERRWQNLH
jgi:hypothetical protein